MAGLGYGCLLNVSFSLPVWFLVRVFGHDVNVLVGVSGQLQSWVSWHSGSVLVQGWQLGWG